MPYLGSYDLWQFHFQYREKESNEWVGLNPTLFDSFAALVIPVYHVVFDCYQTSRFYLAKVCVFGIKLSGS
jgi:hypothetical protein